MAALLGARTLSLRALAGASLLSGLPFFPGTTFLTGAGLLARRPKPTRTQLGEVEGLSFELVELFLLLLGQHSQHLCIAIFVELSHLLEVFLELLTARR